MSNGPKKISELPLVTSLANADLFVVVTNTATSTPVTQRMRANTLIANIASVVANVVIENFPTNLVPAVTNTYTLGNSTYEWASLYVSNSTIYLGGTPLGVNSTGGLVVNGEPVAAATGNIVFNDTTISPNTGYTISIKPASEYFNNTLTIEPTADYDIHLYESNTNGAVTLGRYGATNFRVYGEGGSDNAGNYGNDIRAELASGSTFLIRTNENQDFYNWIFQANGTLTDPEGLIVRTSDYNPYTADANGQIFLDTTYYEEGPAVGNADFIDTNLALTRANQYGLFNALIDFPSPMGTLWNSDGWDDLTNVQNRKFITFYAAANGKLGVNTLAKNFIMKDTINNKYYKINFTVWQQGGGGNFTYTRQQIDGVTGTNIGSPVTFEKTANGQQDDIDTDVSITRSSNQGIYNPNLEGGWNNTAPDSPTNTEWNGDGWENLSNVKSRNYTTLLDASAREGYLQGQQLVMRDTENGKYYAFKFSEWQAGANGGAFSYTRSQINTELFFIRDDSETSEVVSIVDNIAPGLSLARGNGGFLYNSQTEGSYNSNYSPDGTLWNADGWDDLSNVTSRQYVTFGSTFKNATGQVILNHYYVMHDTINNEYWAIKFLRWQVGSNNGGATYPGFTYIRRKIKTDNVSSGVHFADGSVQNQAVTIKTIGTLPQKAVDVAKIYLNSDDMGKHVLVTNSSTQISIPDATKVPMPVGATITLINRSGATINIYKDNDYETGTIYGAGTADSSTTWNIPDTGGGGIVTLIKIRDEFTGGSRYVDWMIAGTNIAVP